MTVENFLRVLTGRHAPGTPLNRRLGSGPGSRVLVYMTGHGGDEFLKFHNHEEVGGADLVRRVWVLDILWYNADGWIAPFLWVLKRCIRILMFTFTCMHRRARWRR